MMDKNLKSKSFENRVSFSFQVVNFGTRGFLNAIICCIQ